MKILAIDLGKFKSVACLFDTESNQTEYETITMQRPALEDLLQRRQPQKVVFETCTNSNWVHDICQGQGYEVLVANPNQEAWQWRNVKRKTDILSVWRRAFSICQCSRLDAVCRHWSSHGAQWQEELGALALVLSEVLAPELCRVDRSVTATFILGKGIL